MILTIDAQIKIEAQVKKIIADNTKNIRQTIHDTMFLRDLGIDSLGQIEVAMVLEDEFDIVIYDDAIEKWKTVSDVFDTVKRLTAWASWIRG